ncbi:MAG: DUF1269 domain-containing protein [Propioniciclava sp.]
MRAAGFLPWSVVASWFLVTLTAWPTRPRLTDPNGRPLRITPTLTVWSFGTTEGAAAAAARINQLQKEELLNVVDGAVVSWDPNKSKPKTHQLFNTTGAGAVTGGFWGLLFGMIFLIPLVGAAFGAIFGAMSGALTDIGIDDSFIAQVRDRVQPGTSALFLMTTDVVEDKVVAATQDLGAHLIQTNLSAADETRLRGLFDPAV